MPPMSSNPEDTDEYQHRRSTVRLKRRVYQLIDDGATTKGIP